MKKNTSSLVEIVTFSKARPLTLEQVLRLRDGLNIARNDVPEYPHPVTAPGFNQENESVLCMN
jgi:hypothetical protein